MLCAQAWKPSSQHAGEKRGVAGRYEHPEESDFIVDEVFMKDGALYAKAIVDGDEDLTFRLYPIGENEFGRKRGMLKLRFGDDCLMFDDLTCRKR